MLISFCLQTCATWVSVSCLSYLHFSSPPPPPVELTTVVSVIGPSESKLAMVSRRCGRVLPLPMSLRVMGPMTCVPTAVFSVFLAQDCTLLVTLLKPACRNLLTAGSVTTTLLAVSSAHDQMKVGARLRVMSR